MKSLSVICPVYNEEEVIELFYRELSAILSTVADRYETEILFVVDRGTDRTLPILKDLAATDSRVRILALSSRFGHQMSLLAGIDHSHGDAVVMLDSDLEHPPSLIPRMLEKFEQGYDIVFTIREEPKNKGLLKKLTSKAFYWLINKLSRIPVEESSPDFRLVSQRVARVFREQIRERNQFLRGLFCWVGFNRVGLSYPESTRRGGRSKYTVNRLFRFAAEGILSFSRRPLQAAIFVGFGFAGFGFILAVVTFFQYLLQTHLPSGWTTLVIIISVFSGVHLIFMGILGEYVGAIFDEVKARPHYIIDKAIGFKGLTP